MLSNGRGRLRGVIFESEPCVRVGQARVGAFWIGAISLNAVARWFDVRTGKQGILSNWRRLAAQTGSPGSRGPSLACLELLERSRRILADDRLTGVRFVMSNFPGRGERE